MKRYLKNGLAILCVLTLILSALLPTFAQGQPTQYSTSANSGTRDVICTSLDGTGALAYYTGEYTYDALSELSSAELLTSLRKLMTSTHKKQTSYADCRDYANRTDCEEEQNNIITLYTSYVTSHSQYNGGSGWNREHVWPKSLGGFNQDGAGADLHHIRPSENRTNSNRGNKLYGEVSSGKTATGNLSGQSGGTYSTYYEPLDNVKGDVARICLYVYVRWGGTYAKSNNIKNVFQSVDVLLEWCELDPVDTWEMGRNEVVETIQGNRNVFIDYPELAWTLFGKEVPSSMTTPSGEAKNNADVGTSTTATTATSVTTATTSPVSTTAPATDPALCRHEKLELRDEVAANCGNMGYSGDLWCVNCSTLLTRGAILDPTGEHSFGDAYMDSNNMELHECSVCGFKEYLSIKVEYSTYLDTQSSQEYTIAFTGDMTSNTPSTDNGSTASTGCSSTVVGSISIILLVSLAAGMCSKKKS